MQYTTEKEIGHGGMGCVYLGHDSNGRKVAIKMMSNKVTCYPEYRKLFQQEVDTLRMMDHPSVVHIVGQPYQDSSGNLYLPMEYVEGETLEQRVNANGPCQPQEAMAIMQKVLEAIQYVHDRRRIHRDIKPSNIMLRPNGSVCVIDFGIAKDAKIGSGGTVGMIIGTDGYMSPEQAKGLNIDSRTDIYSLGCVLYFLLTGKHAIAKGNNDFETVCNILESTPSMPSESNPNIPPKLDAVFKKAVDKNMTKRYQTALEFKQAIESVEGKSSPKVSIGRGAGNDIVVDSLDVSRHHLTITGFEQPLTGGATKFSLEIADSSTNGTGINGRLLKHKSTTIDYNGTTNLPQVFLAGKADLAVDWGRVMGILRSKGWNPQAHKVSAPKPVVQTGESLGFWLCVASFICPLAGWILWGALRNEHPQKASTAAKVAWIGFAVGFISNLIINAL